MTKPTAPITAAAQAERERIMSILALPSAKANRAGAEALAFGSDASPAEAAAALARAADKKAADRERSRASMRKAAGLPPEQPTSYTLGQVSMLKATARGGLPSDRKAARDMLAKAGITL